MKILVTVAFALCAVLFYMLILGVQALTGVGPFGGMADLAAAGPTDTPDFGERWFRASDTFFLINTFVFWPVAMGLAAFLLGRTTFADRLLSAITIPIPAALMSVSRSLPAAALIYLAYAVMVWSITHFTMRRHRWMGGIGPGL